MSLDHHAYVLFRTDNDAREVILERIENDLGINATGNPDVVTEYFENLGIDDAKKITELQSRKAAAGDIKVFIVQCEALTHEAQNALLKTFEEPTPGTYLFLCVPDEATLLPTLRSRMVQFDIDVDVSDDANIPDPKQFLAANAATRLIHIENIVASKNKSRAITFVDGLINEHSASDVRGMKTLLKAEQLLHERGSSIKLILEHLAVTL